MWIWNIVTDIKLVVIRHLSKSRKGITPSSWHLWKGNLVTLFIASLLDTTKIICQQIYLIMLSVIRYYCGGPLKFENKGYHVFHHLVPTRDVYDLDHSDMFRFALTLLFVVTMMEIHVSILFDLCGIRHLWRRKHGIVLELSKPHKFRSKSAIFDVPMWGSQ